MIAKQTPKQLNGMDMSNFDFTAASLKFIGLVLIFTLPIHPIMMTTLALVMADIVTGIWASKKEGKAITSQKFKRKIVLLCCYMLGIFLAFLIETYMVQEAPLVKALAGLIAFTEGKSISENFHRITGMDLWKLFIEKLQGPSIKDTDKAD